ncbi:MAG: hypothetical protein ABW019_16310, partial [Chitinophagaceae bacterium]
MKKHSLILSLFVSLAALFTACQKDLSFETSGTPSAGTLQSETSGDCLPKTVAGVYEAATALDGNTNYIEVQVDVLQAGSYLIYTDTVNGIYFRGTGVFNTAGLNTVRLRGNGTPLAMGISNFVVKYGLSECSVSVPVLPAGGASPAVYTLSSGTGGECMSAAVSGTFTEGALLGSSNTVTINVNVTTIGTYNVSTVATNGITFSGTGALLTTGAGTITLTASGTPTAAGTTNIPVTVGTSSCNFPVTVIGPASFSVDCGSAMVNGTYEEGVALGAGNTVDIQVNVTTVGGYNISGTVNGMTFSRSGNFTATGPQSVTLAGSGTPIADGTFNVPVSAGSSPCSFSVTVDPGPAAPAGTWKFTAGTTTYQGPTEDASVASSGGATTLVVGGGTSSGSAVFSLAFTNQSGGITTGAYSGTAMTGKFNIFMFTDGTITYQGMPMTGSNISATITTFNTTTHIVEGTFSGTAKDGSGNNVT